MLCRAGSPTSGDGPETGLHALEALSADPTLATYPYLSAARAAFLRLLDRHGQAIRAYDEAIAMTDNEIERDFLQNRRDEIPDPDN